MDSKHKTTLSGLLCRMDCDYQSYDGAVQLVLRHCRENKLRVRPKDGQHAKRLQSTTLRDTKLTRMCCDFCNAKIPNWQPHHHCRICDGGDFDLCQICVYNGFTCNDSSHKMIQRCIMNGICVPIGADRVREMDPYQEFIASLAANERD